MLFKAFFMALGMFSLFPTRKNSWDPAYAPLIIPMFPAVGLVIGLAWYAIAMATRDLPVMLHSAAITLVPFILTGFLHIDGFMDSADAVLSRRPLEERRRILKDSNVGAFAVVSVTGLILLQFCAVFSVATEGGAFSALIYIPVISRCFLGVLVLNLTPISNSGYMHTFKEGTKLRHSLTIACTAVLFLILIYTTGGIIALMKPAAVSLGVICTTAYLYNQLQGFSGDLCGCAITVGELCGLIALACF